MPFYTYELLEAVAVLTENLQIRQTMKRSGIYAFFTAACIFLGRLIGGRTGASLGEAICVSGGFVMAGILFFLHFVCGLFRGNKRNCIFFISQNVDDFRSVGDIIRKDLTAEERKQLSDHIINSVNEVTPMDVVKLVMVVEAGPIRGIVIETVISFFSNQLKMEISR